MLVYTRISSILLINKMYCLRWDYNCNHTSKRIILQFRPNLPFDSEQFTFVIPGNPQMFEPFWAGFFQQFSFGAQKGVFYVQYFIMKR